MVDGFAMGREKLVVTGRHMDRHNTLLDIEYNIECDTCCDMTQ